MKLYFPFDLSQEILVEGYRAHELAFIFGQNNFSFVDDINHCDIIPICPGGDTDKQINFIVENVADIKNKIILLLQTTHISEGDGIGHCYKSISQWQEICNNVYYVTLNSSLKTYNKIIFNDFCFNRQKAYFTEYEKYDLTDRLWTGFATIKCFNLNEIKPINTAIKKFLIPNSVSMHAHYEIDHPRIKARLFIQKLIDENDCYYSHPQENVLLQTEEKDNQALDEACANSKHGMGFVPVSNHYFETSIVSAYGETVVDGSVGVRCISEKTFNPLIKGHFILPLAYPGIIYDLKEIYGFRFPDWIDYSYDDIVDLEKRFVAFQQSLNKIRSLSLTELTELRNKDIDILKHNRSIFYNREYDSLYQSLSKEFVKAGLM